MTATVVDRLHEEFSGLLDFLAQAGEVSFRTSADENLRKALLMSVASHFEYKLTTAIESFAVEIAGKEGVVANLVRTKVIARQYHAWFDWNGKNVNKFYSLMGTGFRTYMVEQERSDEGLRAGVVAFLELGRDRNRLVHQDFGTFPMEKTTEEIYAQFLVAMTFVERFPQVLRDFENAHVAQRPNNAMQPTGEDARG